MVEEATDAGYRAFATMIPGRSHAEGGFALLRRNHVQAHHDAEYVTYLLRGHGPTLLQNRLRYAVLGLPKRLLGLRNYDRARHVALALSSGYRSRSNTV
jgi:hypothetical protein